MRFAPLFSGSNGNSVLVSRGRCSVLIDAGVSGKRIVAALLEAGVDAASLSAILVTHEHSDHVSGVGVLSRRYNLPVFATNGTWTAMIGKLGGIEARNIRVIEPGVDFFVDDLNITPFEIPHDAGEPVGYALYAGGIKVSVATDIGCIREKWLAAVARSDILLLESNHDEDMLKAGPYPYDLKRRILGKRGHLSNADAGIAAAELFRRGVKRIVLGHLSGENNFPELALKTVEAQLREEGMDGLELAVDVARRGAFTGVYDIEMPMKEVSYAGR